MNFRDEVLKAIFKYPTKGLSFRQISKLSGVSTPIVSREVKKLEKEGLIFVEKVGRSLVVRGNIADERFRQIKRFYNLFELLPLIEYIKTASFPKTIILFGSYSRGEDVESSDVDLLVLGGKKLSNLQSFEEKLARKIQLFEFNDKLPKEMNYIRKSGVLLYGKFP